MECTPSIIVGAIIAFISAYITYCFTIKRDLKLQNRERSLKAFILSSELLREINLFLTSQKHVCENYEEYQKRDYYGEGFEPMENPEGLINLRDKEFYEFFDFNWLNKFYQFIVLVEIGIPSLINKINQLKTLIEDMYIKREIATLNDNYVEFYNYVSNVENKFIDIHEKIKIEII